MIAVEHGTTTTTAPAPVDSVGAPRREQVAILGFASSTLGEAPVHDEAWEIWGLNQLWNMIPRWDVWFDLHPWHDTLPDHPHVSWLRQQTKPIVMQRHIPDVPASIPYPKDEIVSHFGTYFTSSIAWMLALAIAQGYPVIGVWGVDMLGDGEYAFQRACCDYYIGYARALGRTVILPHGSALARSQGLYGYDYVEPWSQRRAKRLAKRLRILHDQKDEALKAIYMLDGALAELKEVQFEKGEEGRTERQAHLMAKRDAALQHLYSYDGAIQELGLTLGYERHYGRGGA